ncbi:MAG: carbonic anhydrase family protein [Azoarcus sp.]|jgi:carbonic anhydrase|nr:carbonic anhydrase family protein [Azoarcus sp.]
MKSSLVFALALGACGLVFNAGAAQDAAHKAHWSYHGDTGPAHWGDLDPSAAVCKTGARQSPIDLETAKATKAHTPFTLDYKGGAFEFINNGHSIQANVLQKSSTLDLGGLHTLEQFHFHAPSEHTVDGAYFPMELHFVHRDAAGALAVLGVLIREGKENATLAEAFKALPQGEKGKQWNIDIAALLPEQKGAFEYTGSLTTPPCSENVRWIVLHQPIELSKAQIDAFRKLYPDNNRPLQADNDRPVGKN